MRPGRLDLGSVTVEPDLSNAGPFLAAALVTGGSVTIPDWPQDSLQAAGPILDVLGQMGARSSVGADGLTIRGSGRVRGITADLRDVNELAPVLTAAATMADSPSVFTGLAHTRTHETDRLAALAKEINALGGDITELPDGLADQAETTARRGAVRHLRRPPDGDGRGRARAWPCPACGWPGPAPWPRPSRTSRTSGPRCWDSGPDVNGPA